MIGNIFISTIEDHISGPISDWYVGITNNTERRKAEHNAGDEDARWIEVRTQSANHAREVESYFHLKGADGADGGGNEDCYFVYAYRKTNITKP